MNEGGSADSPDREATEMGRFNKPRYIYIAAPDGQAGGGMGRVKDYILQAPAERLGRYELIPLVTRNGRGLAWSVILLLRAMVHIARDAVRGRAALLHVNMGDRGSIARKGTLLLWARLFGVPTCLHLHAAELEAFYQQAGGVGRRLIAWPIRSADMVVVLGEAARQWMLTTFGLSPEKIDILYNGVGASERPVARQFDRQTQTILFLGNLLERKGVSDFISALSKLSPVSAAWRAVIAGGGVAEPYQKMVAELGLVDRVDFPGWVAGDDVQRLLHQADMLVLPSYDEGLPLVILEAMGAGLPVVATPVGVIPEVLTDEQTVLFVSPGDREGLSRQIGRLLGDRNLQSGLSERARILFDARFSLSAFQEALFAIYRQRFGIIYNSGRGEVL